MKDWLLDFILQTLLSIPSALLIGSACKDKSIGVACALTYLVTIVTVNMKFIDLKNKGKLLK